MDNALDRIDASALVPQEYAAYAPLVREALQFFLRRLEGSRRAALWKEQLGLGPGAGPQDRIYALMRRCPSLHKLGQVLARERSLAPGLRSRLQRLETMEPSVPMQEAESLIRAQIGRREDVVLHERPLAEASVALVVPFTHIPGGGSNPVQGVMKILKPGIREALEEELQIWAEMGGYLEERCREYGLPAARYREAVDRMRGLLTREVRLEKEQEHLARAAEFYASDPDVVVPGLFPFCTPGLTAMESIPGRRITASGMHSSQGRRVGEALIEKLIAAPLWTDAEHTPVHGDLHGGNLLLTPDGRVGVLDWSLAVFLDRPVRASLIPVVDAMKTLGLVYIPGMMSGMILGGANPIYAAEYQFVIMGMIFAAGGLTSMTTSLLVGKHAFTDAAQLRRFEASSPSILAAVRSLR